MRRGFDRGAFGGLRHAAAVGEHGASGVVRVATTEGQVGPACTLPTETSNYACQAPEDECKGDLDCPSVGSNSGACLYDIDHRVCGAICALPP